MNYIKFEFLEILDVSHNQISKIPDGCLSRIAGTLRHLGKCIKLSMTSFWGEELIFLFPKQIQMFHTTK